jgi:hypothetical protein
MKRYRILNFSIDATRNFPIPDKSTIKKEMEESLKSRYGIFDFDEKFERYMALEKPVLSVVEEHTYFLEDICDSYVCGYLYSSLTGACCLGERIFNNVIFKVMDDFKTSSWYKLVFGKARRGGSIIDWEDGIQILRDWNIINDEVQKKYLQLRELRNESVHYQIKDQDLDQMAIEAINIVNFIIRYLFEMSQNRKDILLWFDVPGEVFLKKSAESDPMVRAFYIPCSCLVGPYHKTDSDRNGNLNVSDQYPYKLQEISDEEFIRLRNNHFSQKL